MKRLIAITLAAILAASAVSCAAPTSPAASASDTAQYESYLAERGKMPDSLIIGTDSDAKQYGVDMTSFADDGFFTRADNGNVVILAKSDEGIDRAVRDFAKYGNPDDYFKTYNEGYRVKRLTVCGNDISTYCVVRPDDADECMTFAASELVSYIEKTCGARLAPYTETGYAALAAKPAHKITLAVDYPALGDEAFTLAVAENGDVTILGGRYRGCMYGVYALLEDIGWRFLVEPWVKELGNPENDAVDYLYEADSVDLTPAINRTESTSVVYRDLSDSGRTINQNRGNCGVKLRYDPYSTAKTGGYGLIGVACHGIEGSKCLEKAGLFEGIEIEGHQPCFTDPDVVDCIVEDALANVASRLAAGQQIGREIVTVDVSQYDCGIFCDCKRCKAALKEDGSQTGPVLKMTNAVAAALAESYPGVNAAMLAYTGTNAPPKKTVPLDNVVISYCIYVGSGHIACNAHCVNGESCDTNSWFSNVTYADELNTWAELLGHKNLVVWYYPMNAYNFAFESPFFTAIYDDIAYLRALGINGIMICAGEGTGALHHELALILIGKLLWNDLTRDEYWDLCEEYFNVIYGDAGANMYEYFRMCEYAGQRAGCWSAFHSNTADKVDRKYMTDNFDYMYDLFTEAKELADTSHQRDLVEMYESGMLYLCIGLTHTDRYLNGSEADRAVIADRYREMFDIFHKYNLRTFEDFVATEYAPDTLDLDTNPFDSWCTLWEN